MEATKKVYVHYEGEPEFTHVAVIKLGLTAEQLAQEFTRAYNAKHAGVISLDPTSIHLLNGRRRILKSENLIRFVKDRSDIFVEHELTEHAHLVGLYDECVLTPHEVEERNADAVSQQTSLEETSEPAMHQEMMSIILPELAAAAQRIRKAGQELEEPFILGALKYGLKCQQLRKYKLAAKIFLSILEVLPIQQICLRGLGSMALASLNYSEALTWLKIGVAEFPMDDCFHARLGDVYVGLERFEDALDEYDLAIGLISERPQVTTYRETFSGYPIMDARLQRALDRLQCNLLPADDPGVGDVLGSITCDGLKMSSERIRLRQYGNIIKDESINLPEQEHSKSNDGPELWENTKFILISESLLSYGDDLLLQSKSSPLKAIERTMDQISIPALLPDENLKVRLEVLKASV